MRRHVLSVALVAFLVLLGSCGGDDDDAATTAGDGAATTGADGAGTTIDATASEFQFDPNSWTVPVGQPFTVQFENGGTTEHEWVVIALGEDLNPRQISPRTRSCSRSRNSPPVSPPRRSSPSTRRGPTR